MRAAALATLLLAGCGLFRETPNAEIRVAGDDTAVVDVPAPRAKAYEDAIAVLRHLGTPDISSLEGGWITGEIQRWRVRVVLEAIDAGTTRVTVRVRDFAEETSSLETAQRVAGDVLRRSR